MSTVFARFKDAEGNDVFINPLSVQYFRSTYEGHDENLTTIVFDSNTSITVTSSLEDAQKLLVV